MAKKRKKKVPIRTQLRRAAKKAHRAMSLYIRAIFQDRYGHCPLCKVRPVQAVFHILRSKYVKSLRYAIKNVIASCHTCNWEEYRNPDPSRAWYIREYGVEQYLALCDDGLKVVEYSLEDYARIAKEYEDLLVKFSEEKHGNKESAGEQDGPGLQACRGDVDQGAGPRVGGGDEEAEREVGESGEGQAGG